VVTSLPYVRTSDIEYSDRQSGQRQRAFRDLTRCSKGPSCSISSSALTTAKSSAAAQGAGRRVSVARLFFLALFAPALGPRYLPTTRLTTMAAMPASTALAIGDDRMSVIGLDPDACC
jgi:hypothetical protein